MTPVIQNWDPSKLEINAKITIAGVEILVTYGDTHFVLQTDTARWIKATQSTYTATKVSSRYRNVLSDLFYRVGSYNEFFNSIDHLRGACIVLMETLVSADQVIRRQEVVTKHIKKRGKS